MNDPVPVVFVVDDDPSVRKALGRLLRTAGLSVETFASAEEFLQHVLPDAPGCLIVDVRMPGLSGLDLQHRLTDTNIGLPVVFITGHGDIPMTVRAMKAGAVDFLPKPFDESSLLHAVRQAIARSVRTRRQSAEGAAIRQRLESLTPREREVLELVVRGMLNKQIAHRLEVTEKTVKVHRAQVMRKMQADSLAGLVQMAGRIGLMDTKTA